MRSRRFKASFGMHTGVTDEHIDTAVSGDDQVYGSIDTFNTRHIELSDAHAQCFQFCDRV